MLVSYPDQPPQDSCPHTLPTNIFSQVVYGIPVHQYILHSKTKREGMHLLCGTDICGSEGPRLPSQQRGIPRLYSGTISCAIQEIIYFPLPSMNPPNLHTPHFGCHLPIQKQNQPLVINFIPHMGCFIFTFVSRKLLPIQNRYSVQTIPYQRHSVLCRHTAKTSHSRYPPKLYRSHICQPNIYIS